MPQEFKISAVAKDMNFMSVLSKISSNGSVRQLSLLAAEIVIPVLLLAFIVWSSQTTGLSTSTERTVARQTAGQRVQIGQPAPDFTLDGLNGEPVHLKDFAGQSLLIIFWATWCPECHDEMPLLQEVYETYKEIGLVVLAIDVQESPKIVRRCLNEYDLTFPIALDRQGTVSKTYRVLGFPTSVFLDRDGTVVDIHRGPLNRVLLQTYLDKLL